MNNLLRVGVGALIVLTASCQKDYYLEDLNDANEKIEQLERLNRVKAQTITELENHIESDKQAIAELNGEINSLFNDLESLEGLNGEQAEEIAGLKAQLEESLAYVVDLTDELNELIDERDELVAQSEVDQSRLDALLRIISGLEDDLAVEEAKVTTLNGRVDELTRIVSELTDVIDNMDQDEVRDLVAVETPEGRTGLWFRVNGLQKGFVQVYEREESARYAAFNDNIQHLKRLQGGARTLDSAIDALIAFNNN